MFGFLEGIEAARSAGLLVKINAVALRGVNEDEIETLMLDWMQELLGLPDRFRSTSEHGGGVIQGSASEAELVAILAARWRATGGAVNDDGDTTRLVAYGTAHTHSAFQKGLRNAGIGSDHVRLIDHDEHLAMRPDALAAAVTADIEAGLVPFFVCTSHGTTSTTAFDPTGTVAASGPGFLSISR